MTMSGVLYASQSRVFPREASSMSARRRNGVQQRQRRFQRAHLLITVSADSLTRPSLVGALSRPSSSSLATRMAPRRGAAVATSLLSVPALARRRAGRAQACRPPRGPRAHRPGAPPRARPRSRRRRDARVRGHGRVARARPRRRARLPQGGERPARAMAPGAAARRDKAATAARERLGAAVRSRCAPRCASSSGSGAHVGRVRAHLRALRRPRRRRRGGGGGGGGGEEGEEGRAGSPPPPSSGWTTTTILGRRRRRRCRRPHARRRRRRRRRGRTAGPRPCPKNPTKPNRPSHRVGRFRTSSTSPAPSRPPSASSRTRRDLALLRLPSPKTPKKPPTRKRRRRRRPKPP